MKTKNVIDSESSWLAFNIKSFGKCFIICALVPPFALYMLIMMQTSLRIDGNLGITFAWILYFIGFIQPDDPCYYPGGVRLECPKRIILIQSLKMN